MSTAESRASELAPAGSAADEAARRERAAQGVHGYSAWDDFESVVASRESVAIDEPAILFEMRTRIAAAAVNADDPAALRACAEELRTRTKAMAKLAAMGRKRGFWLLAILVILVGVLGWVGLVQFLRADWGAWSLISLVCCLFGNTLFDLLFGHKRPATRTATLNVVDSFVARHCPDCGFDLSNTPDAIAPSVLDGQRIGPAACSECTSKWPLLPAGLPAVHRRLRE